MNGETHGTILRMRIELQINKVNEETCHVHKLTEQSGGHGNCSRQAFYVSTQCSR